MSAAQQPRDGDHPARAADDLWGVPWPRTILLATIVLGALASGTTIAVAAPSITFSIPKILGILAIFVWVLTPIEIAIWRVERVWEHDAARRPTRHSAWGRIGLLPVVAVVGFRVHSSELSVNLFTAGAVLLCLSRIRLMLRLRRLISESPTAVNETGDQRPSELDDSDPVAQGEAVESSRKVEPHALLSARASERQDPPSPVISHCADKKIRTFRAAVSRQLQRTFGVATSCLLVLIMASCLSGIADGLGWDTHKWSKSNGTIKPARNKHNEKSRAGKKQNGSGGGSNKEGNKRSGSEGSGGDTEIDEGSCQPIPSQEGIPSEVIRELQSLYSGPHQLGRAQAGCPFEVKEVSTPEGVLYWVLGKSRGDPNPKGLAVLPPKRFHKAIFLWPALTTVEGIIARKQNVGGPRRFPRYAAGGGDYYVIYSEQGTVLLTREETGTADEAHPYVPLPVSATAAFLSLTQETETWRWPIAPTATGRFKTFHLKLTGLDAGRFYIEYNGMKESASRNGLTRTPDFYQPTQTIIPETELHRWAPAASVEARKLEEEEDPEEE